MAPIGTLNIWLNAFIPYHVRDYTRLITCGMTVGRSAVPLPGIARPLNPTADWDAGFLTDQRGFSDDPLASVRMQSAVSIAVTATAMKPSFPPPRTSGTTEVKLNTGKITGRSDADLTHCAFRPAAAGEAPVFGHAAGGQAGTDTLVLRLKGAASDPLVRGSADIDYEGWFKVVRSGGRLSVDFQGKVDAFPAFEGYASWKGMTRTLFTLNPKPDKTVVNLLGWANRDVSGSAEWA